MNLPPGPRGALLGAFRYMRDPYGFYDVMRRRYGDVFLLRSLNGPLIVSLTPEGARQILAGKEEDFVVGFGVDALKPIIGDDSLLLLSGDAHKRERKVLSPTFHGGRMRAYGPLVQESALRMCRDWTAGTSFVAREAMQEVSLEVILRAVLGAQTPERVAELSQTIREGVNELSPVPIFLPFLQREFGGFGPWARFLRRRTQAHQMIDRQIAEAREAKGSPEAIVTKLVEARYDDGSAMPDSAIRDELITLLVAGHETTSTAMAWALYELAREPRVLARLRDEIGGEADPEKLARIPYLDAFCRETLRMHPIAAEFFRTVKTSFSFEGYEIPTGYTLAAVILTIHRDPELYPQPDQFRPERFLDRRFAPHEFAAFGGGHRHCIGAAFAMNELAIVLGTLIPRFELRVGIDRPLKTVRRNVILTPERGVPMLVERRLDSAPARAA